MKSFEKKFKKFKNNKNKLNKIKRRNVVIEIIVFYKNNFLKIYLYFNNCVLLL